MRPRLIFVAAFFLAVIPFAAVAEPNRKGTDVEPPRLETLPANPTGQDSEALADALAVTPEIPLGPLDLLKEYEQEMSLITQRMSAEIASILVAQQTNQMSREQAEYLIQERYQVAMMQHEVLSGMHEALERDLAQTAAAAKRLGKAGASDTAVVVELTSSAPSAGCN